MKGVCCLSTVTSQGNGKFQATPITITHLSGVLVPAYYSGSCIFTCHQFGIFVGYPSLPFKRMYDLFEPAIHTPIIVSDQWCIT